MLYRGDVGCVSVDTDEIEVTTRVAGASWLFTDSELLNLDEASPRRGELA
jgi:hypothetical protein